MSKLVSMPPVSPSGVREVRPRETRRPRLTRSGAKWGLGALIVVVFALFLLGNSRVSLWDRDEPRYAECSREMLQTGDWVVPHLLGEWRTQKPPFIYWCEGASMRVLGDGPFAARLPSVLAITLLLVMLAVVLYGFIGPARALATVFVLATNVLIVYDAKQCLTDSVLLLWITIAQLCLFAIYRGHASWPIVITFWVAQGLASLTKGPMGLMVSLATMVALAAMDYVPAPGSGAPSSFSRFFRALFLGPVAAARIWWRRLRPLAGFVILALIVAPWLILVHHRAPGFLSQMFHVFGAHVAEGTEQHGGPPGWHLIAIWGTFLPWSLFLPVALGLAWKHRRLPSVRFALATVLGTWVLVEAIRTKLPHYILPAFPALAFLTGDALVRCIRGQYRPLNHIAYRLAAVAFAIILLGLGAAPWLLALPKLALRPQPWAGLATWSVAAALCGIGVGWLLWTRRLLAGSVVMGLGTLALIAVLYGLYLPNARFLQLPVQIADCLKQHGATHPGDAVMIEYKEDSVPYYQGGTLRREADDRFLNKHPDPATWPSWMVIAEDAWQRAPAEARDQFTVVQTFRGLNYVSRIAGSNLVTVLVVRKRDNTPGLSAPDSFR